MAKIFGTYVKKVRRIIQSGGLPTFVYKVFRKTATTLKLSLNFLVARTATVFSKLSLTLGILQNRAVIFTIAAMLFYASRRANKTTFNLSVALSESSKRRVIATLAIRYEEIGTKLFVVPSGITSLKIEAEAGGGGPGDWFLTFGGGGGGGGGYGLLTLEVVAGDVIEITVGDGGFRLTAARGSSGQSTIVKKNGLVVMTVTGGQGGDVATALQGGAGGAPGAASGSGVASTSGTAGANGAATNGGGGGGGGGPLGGPGSPGGGSLATPADGGLYGGASGGIGTSGGLTSRGARGTARLTYTIG